MVQFGLAKLQVKRVIPGAGSFCHWIGLITWPSLLGQGGFLN